MKLRFLIIPFAGLILGACTLPFVGKNAEQAVQTAEQRAVEQEMLQNCKYDKPVCQYLAAQIGAFDSGFSMTSIITGKNPMETVTQIDGQGNMSSVSTQNGKETSAMIVFNNDTYFKDYDDGQWLKMTSDQDSNSDQFDIPTTAEDIKAELNNDEITTTYTKLGQEACGDAAPGLTCDVYQMVDSSSVAFSSKIWIDTKDHLSRKMELDLGETGKNLITYSYQPVSISQPSPVKEFEIPNFDTGSGEIPSQADIEKMMKNFPEANPSAGE